VGKIFGGKMPRKKKSEDIFEGASTRDQGNAEETRGRKTGKRVSIPVKDDGSLDETRARPEQVAKARAILEGGKVPEAVKVPEMHIPREFIPFLYDGATHLIRMMVRLAKWPRVMTTEQREEFCGYLGYSDEFKKEATEPTALVLEKAVGSSKLALWLMEHSEVAMLVMMIGKETAIMFHRAAAQFSMAHKEEIEAAQVKANGGAAAHPPSENRPIPSPIAVGAS
jgi:hypothetical protein